MGSDKIMTHPAPTMSVKLEGPLTKWTNVVQGWQYRWFVLDENTCLLSYYTSKDKMMKGARRGCLRLKGGKIGINDEDDSTFTITCDHRTFHFQARDGDERTRWVQSLEEVILKHSSGCAITPGTNLAMEEELNHRMQEAEGYFRLVTEQAKNLELKLNQPNKVKTERCVLLKDSMTQMIETMGQTIELLHTTKQSLAKKVPVPVLNKKTSKGSYQNGSTTGSTPSVITLDSDRSPDTDNRLGVPTTDTDTDNISLSTEASLNTVPSPTNDVDSLDCAGAVAAPAVVVATNGEKATPSEVMSSLPRHVSMSLANSIVPTSSYTSSDEEDGDEFFDAEDEFSEQIDLDLIADDIKAESHKTLIQSAVAAAGGGEDDGMIYLDEVKLDTPQSQVKLDVPVGFGEGEDEWDVEDEDVEGGDTDMAAHGSVITHLLSQVRIGMDLTKVTLPTFILERRSLLEMYADFFAHPDLFKYVAAEEGADKRMMAVLKWYLSSFHAGRKGDVAKKPYNPILGETFQCFYDMSTTDGDSKTYSENNHGTEPIPWSKKSDVSFLAEQVSHHPPISAFYAECAEKNVCFNAHIWTKSKFLGLSVGVHNVGTGNLFLSDYDEEYVMTFPNGFGRSILTVPWIELGGKTEITCKSSGYTTQLEFHTKPFYGGKKNRITADVYRPGERKPFVNINGEWNGVMYAKYADEREPQVFFDTTAEPTQSKKVRALRKQQSFESRSMWKDVTRALKENDIEGATEGKHKNEERQRQDARMRKETNTKWVTRFFDELGEGEERVFNYKRPLYSQMGLPKPGGT